LKAHQCPTINKAYCGHVQLAGCGQQYSKGQTAYHPKSTSETVYAINKIVRIDQQHDQEYSGTHIDEPVICNHFYLKSLVKKYNAQQGL